MKKDFLRLMDLTTDELYHLLDLGAKIKADLKQGIKPPYLAGKTLGMIFQKASTRTRVSFETGMYQLGGYPLYLSGADMQIGRGEPIEDTARVLSRYLDGIMIRTFEQSMVEKLAEYATIPIINGLTDYAHPCQILADFMTIIEHKGKLEGLKIAYIGDGNNMANSIIVGGIKAGMTVACASPEHYHPAADVLDFANASGRFLLTADIREAAKDADVIFTDVWASMGQESEAEQRRQVFRGYCVDENLMSVAAPGAMVQHCLPAHRGEEISAETFEKHAVEIFDEAENRLHAQKAVMVALMQDR